MKKRMKINHLPFLAFIVLYTVLQSVSAEQATFYDALRDELPPKARDSDEQNGNQIGIGLERDEELFEVAYRFIKQLTETRKSLAALKDVLSYLDDDLKQKSVMLEERYVKGKDLWNLLKEAVRSESAQEKSKSGLKKRMCRVNLGGHCQTENAASLASQMHFLSSGLSPGKRRRRNVAAAATIPNGANVRVASERTGNAKSPFSVVGMDIERQ